VTKTFALHEVVEIYRLEANGKMTNGEVFTTVQSQLAIDLNCTVDGP